MDNASKALIMAGAILISLALVGLGVYIFSISSDLQDDTTQQMDVMAAQTKNKQLSNYAGDKVRGSSVNALMDLVRTLNIQEVFPVDIKLDTTSTDSNFKAASGAHYTNSGERVRDSAWFEVIIKDDEASDGYLDTIYIRQY